MISVAGTAENPVLYTLELPSASGSIVILEKFLSGLYEEYNFTGMAYRDIWVCLNEAVTNGIIHGNSGDPSKFVSVSAELTPGHKWIFIVTDEGCGFDLNTLPNPVLPENLEKAHGRGVHIIKSLADKCILLKRGSAVEMHFKA